MKLSLNTQKICQKRKVSTVVSLRGLRRLTTVDTFRNSHKVPFSVKEHIYILTCYKRSSQSVYFWKSKPLTRLQKAFSKLTTFPDKFLHVAKIVIPFYFDTVENSVEKRRKRRLLAFSPIPTMFQKAFSFLVLKVELVR